jgi:LPS O-antigen subunit length determinant protein (WzzB/FepE family)
VPAIWALAMIATAALLGCALGWAYDYLQRKAFDATLTESERAQFNDYRLVLPWRNFANVVEMDRADAQRDRLRVLYEQIRAEKAPRLECEHDAKIRDDALRSD